MNAYEAVEKHRKSHPEKSVKELCKKVGVGESAYYYAKTHYKKPKKKKSYAKIAVPQDVDGVIGADSHGRVVVVMGTPDQIREVLR